MAFKITENIYEDENFSISERGKITVYGKTSMDEIHDKLAELFPDRVKTDKRGNRIIDLNEL